MKMFCLLHRENVHRGRFTVKTENASHAVISRRRTNVAFRHTCCRQLRPGRSHMVGSRPCHWTDPSAAAAGDENRGPTLKHQRSERGNTSKLSRVFPAAPDTGRSCVPRRGACRSNFLCPDRRSFLPEEFPEGCSYTLPKHTDQQ